VIYIDYTFALKPLSFSPCGLGNRFFPALLSAVIPSVTSLF